MANFTDFNPAFSQRLGQFREALDAAGIKYSMESGYRSPEQQAEIYARSHQGKDFAAAPPWRSFHNYGLAADIIPSNANDYQRMWDIAPQYGLKALGAGDKPHFQLAGRLDDLISQYHLANWRPGPSPAQGALAYAGPSGGPSRPVSRTAGTSLNSNPMDLVATLESGNTNVAQKIHDKNTDRGTPAGGYFQIIDPTWRTYAAAAGVDVNQYPTAMSAPRDIQAKVAGAIPVNQWGPNTVAALQKQFPGMDTSMTLGQWQSKALGGSGTPASAPPAVAAAPAAPGGLPGFQAGSAAEKMTQAGLKQLQGGGGGAVQPMQLQPAMGGSAVGGPMMLGAGGQNVPGRSAQMAQNQLAQLAALAQANSVQPMNPNSAPAMATGMPALPGTTLNSPSALQMALMSGSFSPYDRYGSS